MKANCWHGKHDVRVERIQKGELDPSVIITHHMSLDDAPRGYDIFVNDPSLKAGA